jgi:hypothetical protein
MNRNDAVHFFYCEELYPMLKKIFAVAAFCLALTCASASAADAQEQAIADAMAAMAKQPALTQADVEAYLAFASMDAANSRDPEAIKKAFEEVGLSAERFGYVAMKITLGMALSQGATREQLSAGSPEFMIPNDEELAIINDNLPAIMQAMMGAVR